MAKSLAHYLDACIVVKLVTNEPDSNIIKEYVLKRWAAHFHVTEFAFYETLTVLKRKWTNKEISESQYTTAVLTLDAYIGEKQIQIDGQFKPHQEPRIILDLRELVRKYEIDYSDALQVYTVMHGFWKCSVPEWEPVFVTADAKLEKAARLEGLRTWHFPHGAPPKDE